MRQVKTFVICSDVLVISLNLKYNDTTFIYNKQWIVVCGLGEYNVEEYSAKVYKTKPVEFTNVSTGEVIEYSSVKLAWRTTGITPRTIYKYLDTGLECKGFIIRTLTAKSVSESL